MITTQNSIALSRNRRLASPFGAVASANKTHSAAEVLGRGAEEGLQQVGGALRGGLRKEMPAFDRASGDIVGPHAPQRERAFRIPAVERAVRAPQRQHGTADLLAGLAIGAVMDNVDAGGSAVLLADRCGVPGIAQDAD